jgi:putative oxidoreductase
VTAKERAMATNSRGQSSEQVADSGIFGRLFFNFTDEFYLLFRLIFAFLVALHGAQKAFGLWGFPVPAGMPIVNVAGWVEFISALLIGFGFLTRLGAGALVVTMIVAYFMMHAPNGIWPHFFPNPPGDTGSAFVASGGEVTILWFAIAGIIGIMGSRKWGIEQLLFKKEIL